MSGTTYAGVSPADAPVLASRAISPEVAAQRGTRTITAAEAVSYGFRGAQARSGLIIPQHNTQRLTERHQLRPHEPLVDEDGKPRKYEWVAGVGLALDVPPASQPYIPDVSVDLVLTESALKGDAIQSAIAPGELCVIDVVGVWGWRSNKQPLSDFHDIPFCEAHRGRITRRRRVTILFDSDTRTNPHVQRARRELTAFLRRKGADVRWVDLPPDSAGEKQGIDDVLAAGYRLADLLAEAYAPPADLAEPEPDAPTDEVAELRAKVVTLETALRLERTLRMEEHAVLGDSSRPAQERICAVKLQWEARRVARHETIAAGSGSVVAIDETGAIHLNVRRWAEISGTSPKHAGTCLKTWEAQGWIKRPPVTRHRVGELVDAEGEIKPRYESVSRVRPSGDLDHMLADYLLLPARVAPKPKPRPKAHCPEHPDADIFRRTITECSVCHEEVQPEKVSRHKVGDPALNEPEVRSETTPVESAPSPGPHDLLPHLGLFQDEPAWLADAPEPEEDVIVYNPPSDLEPARNALVAADRTRDRLALDDLGASLSPIARARGKTSAPKPGSVAGDDVWTWR
ncbi:MAG: DUF3854 domain-containing protein [Chloroflexota bacterium]|nr:DUF3854 domain-containing protein [Chloroflexota bacterium]